MGRSAKNYQSALLDLEKQLSLEYTDKYELNAEVEILLAFQAICSSFGERFALRIGELTQSPGENPADIHRTFGLARSLATALLEFEGGRAEFKARYRALQRMSILPSQEAVIKQDSAQERTQSRKQRENAPKLSAKEIKARATRIVENEEKAAHDNYVKSRADALARLKASSGEMKQEALADIDTIEADYSKKFGDFRSGRRLQQVVDELSAKKIQRPKPPSTRTNADSKRSHAKQKIQRQNSYALDPNRILLDEIYREARRANRQLFSEREVAQHPFKTNDTKDDRQYQTHGVRNPRAKRNI